ncbi:rab geranylgeranyltransferase subunit alpha isoform X1 [Megalopta genalis]|uniref:rab geranylgeranyltransferase subunit alpha isoform X1 n=2 Tax=Megalopta genalis TaxID=115081 RepID=UPI003FCFA36C
MYFIVSYYKPHDSLFIHVTYHGRVKVRTTAEQEAIKKKERAKKLAEYRAGMGLIFQKRRDQIYDDELMTVTERLLIENSDIYTLWNIRREAFTKNDWNEEHLNESYQHELVLTENCLKSNPKSYYVWYQRIWIMEHMREPDWKRELMLCSRYLNIDERNFHCWNHRRYVVQKAEVSLEDEFKYSTSKIMNNFSNYSSWHYRSRLLSTMFDKCNQETINQKKKDELDLVMNATFTDPNDTSAWFYQRWLLNARDFDSALSQVLLQEDRIILFTDRTVSLESISLHINNEIESVQWKSWQETKFSKLLFGKFKKELNEIGEIQVTIEGKVYPIYHFNKKWVYKKRKSRICYNQDQLLDQLSNYKQLIEMEPDNKWAILTAVHLMRKIDFVKFNDDILTNLNTLLEVDPLRFNYYKDLRSKYIIEYKLHELWSTEEDNEIKLKIDLSGLNLTTLSTNEYLSFFEELNLSSNCLSISLHQLSLLQNCKKLSLSSNQLESLEKFPTLDRLKVLSLRNNKLNNLQEILQLLARHKLKSLDLRENPVCNATELKIRIMEINQNLELHIE